MQLILTIPTSWPICELRDQRVATVAPDVLLAWGSLVPFPHAPTTWIRRAMQVDVDDGAWVRPGAAESCMTRTGWKFQVLDGEVVAADGSVVEYRLGAFYELMEYGAVALVRAKQRAMLELVRSRLLAVLETGAPGWQADGLVVCLHDLHA